MKFGSRIGGFRVVVAAVCLGVAFGVAAFELTSTHPRYAYLGPLCATENVSPGFDPWTGLPYGRSYLCVDSASSDAAGRLVTQPVPAEIADRRALPLPLGVALGWLIATPLTVWWLRRQRRQGPRPERPRASRSIAWVGAAVALGTLVVLFGTAPMIAAAGLAAGSVLMLRRARLVAEGQLDPA